MVIAVLVAAALAGTPLLPLGLVGLVWVSPLLGGVLLGGLMLISEVSRRRRTVSREGELLDIAAQLRAGRTLRAVIAESGASSAASRLAVGGRPLAEVVQARWGEEDHVGPLLCDALVLVSDHGGPAAPVFEAAARLLIDDAGVRREIRMASAGPLAQGLLVGGVPLAFLVVAVVTGSFFERIGAGGVLAVTSLAGGGLIGAGVLCTGWLVRRALR